MISSAGLKNSVRIIKHLGVIIFCILGGIYLPMLFLRILLCIVISIAIPGYLFTYLLWPRKGDIGYVDRLALIIPISLAILTSVLLIANYLFSYNYELVVISLGFLNCILYGLSIWRSQRKYGTFPDFSIIEGMNNRNQGKKWHEGQIAVMGSLTILILAIVFVFFAPQKSMQFTAIYVKDGNNHVVTHVTYDDLRNKGIIVGVSNHEGKSETYKIIYSVLVQNLKIQIRSDEIFLDDGESVELHAYFVETPPESSILYIDLFLNTEKVNPYRSLKLQVYQPSDK